MKKIISVILVAAVLCCCSSVAFAAEEKSDFGAYESVIILGIDGAGAFFDNTPTPNMDRIFSENSFVSHHAKAETQTSSAQNWASILMGVAWENHGINNDIAGSVERTSAEKYPTIFRTVRESMPNAVLTSISHWNPINFGIIENDIGVIKETGSDPEVCDKVINAIETNMPTLMFVQLDDVDHVGHTKGFGSKAHLEEITRADEYIGRIYASLEKSGALEETLFVVVSDHGGTRVGGHGGPTFGEKFVYVGVKGKTVGENNTYAVRNRDVASIALYALGVEESADMVSNVPNGLFEGSANEEPTARDGLCIFFEKFLMRIVNLFADIFGKI